MTKRIVKPKLIAFEVTRRCRFSCRHCRANAGIDCDDELTTGRCKKILTSVAKFSKPVIILTGGEPMERRDIYKLIQHCRRLGLKPVLATCGYLINEKSITKLKEAGVMALSFSLEGASAETNDRYRQVKGAFDSVIETAALARKKRIRFQINTTISKINIGEVIGIADLAKRLGAYCFNPFILVPTGRGKQMQDAILDAVEYEALLGELLRIKLKAEIKVRITCGPQFARVCRQAKVRGLTKEVAGCMGGRGFGFISYRGDVQICGFLDISAGNLIENGFKFSKIWQESKLLKEIRDLSGYTGKCRGCDFAGVCGGCRARAYAASGDYLASDPVCDYKGGDKN